LELSLGFWRIGAGWLGLFHGSPSFGPFGKPSGLSLIP